MSISRLFISFFILSFSFSAASESAYVNLTGAAPSEYENKKQPLTIYACDNTEIHTEMKWKERNIRKIPFGWHRKGDKDFFISKYYIASPPLPNSFSAGQPLTLGVLSVDHFSINKHDERVDVFMDYKRLKPIELGYLTVDYSANSHDSKSCIDKNINVIPINIRCPSFRYTKGNKTGLGKGIAQLSRNVVNGRLSHHGQLFIPLEIETKQALKGCTVEVLNDIILDHQIYFDTSDGPKTKINLTKAYHAYKDKNRAVNLFCRSREKNQPPSGCRPVDNHTNQPLIQGHP